MKINHNKTTVAKRKLRVRSKMQGGSKQPRISVYRSNRFTFAQAIDDDKGVTLAAVHVKSLKSKAGKLLKLELAKQLGEELGKLLKTKKIVSAVFDRGAYRFHGRVKAVAEGLRQQGIKV